jgi:hypothetical protein
MPSNGWQNKGDKSVRRSPRQSRRKCARPFTAPRSVTKDKGKTGESEVQGITETENARDIEGRQEEVPQVIPFEKGLTMLSEREADEYAEHGEVLRLSTDSEAEQRKEQTPENIQSDSTDSTPEMFKSPDVIQDRVPGSNTNETSLVEETVEATIVSTVSTRKYKGWVFIPETEANEGSSESDDNEPIASQLQPQTVTSIRLQELQDFKEGPVGKRAIGKIVAKIFDRVEFRGKVDSFRKVRQRYYYHITYDDGDEEETRQIELRDAYLLANTDKIQTEGDDLQVEKSGKGKEVASEESSQGETDSGSEGSEYDRHDFEKEMKQGKRQRKTTFKRATKRPTSNKRAKNQRKNDLSGAVLPQSGDKSVAGEAFAKLDIAQQGIVKDKVNKKTKQVLPEIVDV